MNPMFAQPLEDDMIRLRAFARADAPAMFRNWASDDEVTRYLRWPSHRSVADTELVVDGWAAQAALEAGEPLADLPTWAIELKELGEPVGSIAVVGWDDAHEAAEVGYCVGRAWWHRGIASRALALVLGRLLGELGVPRVEAVHDAHNPRSGLVMQRCGMRRATGEAEPGADRFGSACEMVRYAVTREQWAARG